MCRRCSECSAMTHHWIYNSGFGSESEEIENNATTHVCKHCDAVGNVCRECDGDGYSRESSLGDNPCAECGGEGVILFSGGDVVLRRFDLKQGD